MKKITATILSPEESAELAKKFNLNERAAPVVELDPTTKFKFERQLAYGYIESQLNDLFDDIEAGLFGAKAKQGNWYKRVRAAKEKIPKPAK